MIEKYFFVHGGTDIEDREAVRIITEKENNAVIIASYGTFSTGINIKRLHNIIFASPSKSRVRNLQSIGRVLRKEREKTLLLSMILQTTFLVVAKTIHLNIYTNV